MKNFLDFTRVLSIVGGISLMLAIVGCETNSADELVISISPSYASIGVGESVTLTASGGWNYRWALSNSSIGSLSANSGERVVYTARVASDADQIITLSGMGNDPAAASSSSSTNAPPKTASSSFTATATINHPGVKGGGATGGTSLTISGDATMSVGDSVTLSVSGGDGAHYSWHVSNPSIGRLNGGTGKSLAYTATANGVQTIHCTSGSSKTQHIIRHDSSSKINIRDSQVKIGPNHPSVTLTVENSGGEVTWYVSGPFNVTKLSATTASVTSNGADNGNTGTVTAVDSTGSDSCKVTYANDY